MPNINERETGEDQTATPVVPDADKPKDGEEEQNEGVQPEFTTPREDQNASETTVVKDAKENQREVGTETQIPGDGETADQSSLGGTGGTTAPLT